MYILRSGSPMDWRAHREITTTTSTVQMKTLRLGQFWRGIEESERFWRI